MVLMIILILNISALETCKYIFFLVTITVLMIIAAYVYICFLLLIIIISQKVLLINLFLVNG